MRPENAVGQNPEAKYLVHFDLWEMPLVRRPHINYDTHISF